jgi:hypothetical protein
MPKIPQPAYREKTLSKTQRIANHLSAVACDRGLYFTALYDKVGKNLKVTKVTPGESIVRQGFWLRCNIQGDIVKLLIFTDQFEHLMDGNGQLVELPK